MQHKSCILCEHLTLLHQNYDFKGQIEVLIYANWLFRSIVKRSLHSILLHFHMHCNNMCILNCTFSPYYIFMKTFRSTVTTVYELIWEWFKLATETFRALKLLGQRLLTRLHLYFSQFKALLPSDYIDIHSN
jgi:hypothetical protein